MVKNSKEKAVKKKNLLLDLFLTFAKIGVFTFGGGYAMISVIEDICVEKKKWITHDDMMNVTVVAESTPGPIAINCATFVGYQQAGFAGSVITTLGIVLPSFLKVLWWFLRTARRCSQIVIYTTQKRGAQCEPLEID